MAWYNLSSSPVYQNAVGTTANTSVASSSTGNSSTTNGGGMGLWGIVGSLLGSLASSNSSQSGGGGYTQSNTGGMWSSYMPMQSSRYQSAGGISGMLDVSGRAQAAKRGDLDRGSVIGDTFLGGGLGLFTKAGKKKSYEFDPYSVYSDPQLSSVRALESLASQGSGGGIDLGKAYAGDLGYYRQNEGELGALRGLQGLLTSGDITGARDVYSRMANNKFNPDDPSSGYASFSRALAKAGTESSDVLNREAAMTGSRFGTGIQRQKASLAEDMQNQRGMYLADLFNQGENRAMAGASGLQSLIGTQQDLFNNVAAQSALERQLKNQELEDKYAEFIRQQNEQYMRIGLMQDQKSVPMGKITYTM